MGANRALTVKEKIAQSHISLRCSRIDGVIALFLAGGLGDF
jgi:hypothetical protein